MVKEIRVFIEHKGSFRRNERGKGGGGGAAALRDVWEPGRNGRDGKEGTRM